MNFEFADKINSDLEKLDFTKALLIAEAELRKISVTPFHEILGKSLTGHADDLANWVEKFFQKASRKVKVKALYFEMNEFDINTDLWFIDCFAFSNDGGLNLDDMDWLCAYDADSQTETGKAFSIQGYERLQSAFETIEIENNDLQNARDWCEQIVIARFMELMRAAHLAAKQRVLKWANVPIYFTEHAYDFVVRSVLRT